MSAHYTCIPVRTLTDKYLHIPLNHRYIGADLTDAITTRSTYIYHGTGCMSTLSEVHYMAELRDNSAGT